MYNLGQIYVNFLQYQVLLCLHSGLHLGFEAKLFRYVDLNVVWQTLLFKICDCNFVLKFNVTL